VRKALSFEGFPNAATMIELIGYRQAVKEDVESVVQALWEVLEGENVLAKLQEHRS
jgi:hypothetical protein